MAFYRREGEAKDPKDEKDSKDGIKRKSPAEAGHFLFFSPLPVGGRGWERGRG
jgi:hypothetical protein